VGAGETAGAETRGVTLTAGIAAFDVDLTGLTKGFFSGVFADKGLLSAIFDGDSFSSDKDDVATMFVFVSKTVVVSTEGKAEFISTNFLPSRKRYAVHAHKITIKKVGRAFRISFNF